MRYLVILSSRALALKKSQKCKQIKISRKIGEIQAPKKAALSLPQFMAYHEGQTLKFTRCLEEMALLLRSSSSLVSLSSKAEEVELRNRALFLFLGARASEGSPSPDQIDLMCHEYFALFREPPILCSCVLT